MAIKFIHCADLHLGSVFKGLSRACSQTASSMFDAIYSTYDNIIELAIKENVDFVLMAGDLIDDENKSLNSLLKLNSGFKRLSEKAIKVFLVHGNHDPFYRIDGLIDTPSNVKIFSPNNDKWHEFTCMDGTTVAIWGMSFSKKNEPRNLAKLVPEYNHGDFKIVLLHQTIGTSNEHLPYAPCNLSDCDHKADYWALGHIHKPAILSESPLVVYPGIPQGRSFKETGPRGCYLVKTSSPTEIDTKFIEICRIRWEELKIVVTGLSTIDKLQERILSEIKAYLEKIHPKGLICRLLLKGTNEIIKKLFWQDEIQQFLDGLNEHFIHYEQEVFISEIKDQTNPPIDVAERKKIKDLVGYALKEADEILNTVEGQKRLKEALSPLFSKKELKEVWNGIPIERELEEILENAKYMLLDLLENDNY